MKQYAQHWANSSGAINNAQLILLGDVVYRYVGKEGRTRGTLRVTAVASGDGRSSLVTAVALGDGRSLWVTAIAQWLKTPCSHCYDAGSIPAVTSRYSTNNKLKTLLGAGNFFFFNCAKRYLE